MNGVRSNVEAQVVVGARSAIFAPLKNIGVIIVDEEHEASYKQDEAPRYHARDLAIWRSQYHHCPVVLGSATPSLESRARAQKKSTAYWNWISGQKPVRNYRRSKSWICVPNFNKSIKPFRPLQEKLQTAWPAKNRSSCCWIGAATLPSWCAAIVGMFCLVQTATSPWRCIWIPNDALSLCGHEEHPHRCPLQCRQDSLLRNGHAKSGRRVEELFPEARVLRMDVDTTHKKGAHEKILTLFGEKKADILLGTQMIAKGLDFPDITLVGVLNADTALNLPDFRSSERTFQLLTQVSGRAGRAEKTGEVVIKHSTLSTTPSIGAVARLRRFLSKEMWMRHQSGYPPYYFTVKITCSHPERASRSSKMFDRAGSAAQ